MLTSSDVIPVGKLLTPDGSKLVNTLFVVGVLRRQLPPRSAIL